MATRVHITQDQETGVIYKWNPLNQEYEPTELGEGGSYSDAQAVAAVEEAGLTLAAAKNIVFANDGVIELGTLTGTPCLFAGNVDSPYEVFIQPKEGNLMGELAVMPSGVNGNSAFVVWNSSDYDNGGFGFFFVDGSTLIITKNVHGTGLPIDVLKIDFDTVPYMNLGYGLGNAARWWKHIKAQKHEIIYSLGVDHTWSGTTTSMTAGTALTRTQAVYVGGDSKMEKALATGTATMPAIALCAYPTIAEDAEGEFLLQGFFRDDTWDWAIGGLLYISKDTAGALTQTLPAASGEQVQVVGVAITADIIYFNPSYELVEIS